MAGSDSRAPRMDKTDKKPTGGEVLANLISIDGLVSDLDGEARGEYGVSVHLRDGGDEALAVWAERWLDVRPLDAEEGFSDGEADAIARVMGGPAGGER